uniref:Uncharacterized protein n=1 Tax=Brugia malayi TaxID=6279 RepID=A8PJU6_BRUMA
MHLADICTCTQGAITVYSHIPTYATYSYESVCFHAHVHTRADMHTHTHTRGCVYNASALVYRSHAGRHTHPHTQGAQTAVEFELPPRAATRDMYLHWVQCVASLYDMRELASRACSVVITCHFRVLWGFMA